MSRLQALPIPFAAGHSDEVDEKLLPNGIFADVSNGRLPAVGSLRLRRGWRPVPMLDRATAGSLDVIDLYSFGDSLVALTLGASAAQTLKPAVFVESNAARPWVLHDTSMFTPATQVRYTGNILPLDTDIIRASAALTADGVYGCVLQSSSTVSAYRVFNRETDETVTYGVFPNGSRVRKIVSMGATFGMVENTGTGLDLYSFNPTGTASGFGLVATLLAATVVWFDVAVATETTPTVLHVAVVIGDTASYLQFTFAGVQVGSTKTVLLNGAEAVTLCSDDATVNYVYQLIAGNEVVLETFAATGAYATTAGPTNLNPGQDVVEGLFCVGMDPMGPAIFVASEHASGGTTDLFEISHNLLNITHASNVRTIALGQQLCSGFLTRPFVRAVGLTRTNSGVGLVSATGGTSLYVDLVTGGTPWFYGDFGSAAQFTYFAHAPFWPAQCPTGDALVILPRDDTPQTAASPIIGSVRALRVRSSERRPAAQVNGGLYITGGVLDEWVGGLNDQGMLSPIIAALVGSNGAGTLANGTYQYVAVMVWQDEKQYVHRSIVSGIAQTTLAGANDTVTATVYAAKTLRRNENLITNPRIELFRTEVGPAKLFYLVGSSPVLTSDDAVTIVDTVSDTDLVAQAQLYTQGEFGATSGTLDLCPARPSSFAAATKRRLILGSADTSYQWSQISFPEIPIWFAEPGVVGDAAQAYHDDVEAGRITGVAALDEVVFLGTAERIYVTGGTGPNIGGVGGEFSPPSQLPADVGFFNAMSILETSEGLWFLGSLNTFYLLPRGTPTPEISKAVQDRLTTAVVGCGYAQQDEAAVWATTAGTAIVRQIDSKHWFGDTLPFIPIALHAHEGVLYAIDSNREVWQQSPTAFGDGAAGATAVALRVATGQIGPFEMAGWGRLAVVEVLGEFQAAAAILAEISYDDGLTWTTLGTHTVTGLAVGAAFQRQWYPARQRGERFRCRFTMTPSVTTTEGCRLTGSVVYYTKQSGQTRLDSAKRR